MTNEEIIAILESYKNYEDSRTEDLLHHGYDNTKEAIKRKEALDEAIKALFVPEGIYINKAELLKRMLGHINRFAEEKNFSINEGLKYAQGVICGMPTFYMRGGSE